ncbi:PREDICTED: uncharacterized protein LOC104799038 [Tarenaya hassleriana]|uniref:uncharacterized protein LOC104799038 n=1 Tax=Tarenaya hassleriana TaxID=28532 RepID=UPI00053C2CB8|nr:PREDICTED: uncharacterized protein LOC104799038 [Tarenaya hassleriana]
MLLAVSALNGASTPSSKARWMSLLFSTGFVLCGKNVNLFILHLIVSAQSSKSSDVVATISGNQFRPKQKPLCTHCGMYGHTVNKCYKLHGYPPGYRRNQRISDTKTISVSPRPPPSKSIVAAVRTDSGLHNSNNSFSENDLFSPQQLQKLYHMLGERLNMNSAPSVSASGAPDKSGSYSKLHDWEG